MLLIFNKTICKNCFVFIIIKEKHSKVSLVHQILFSQKYIITPRIRWIFALGKIWNSLNLREIAGSQSPNGNLPEYTYLVI
jgi:hypothetical protein